MKTKDNKKFVVPVLNDSSDEEADVVAVVGRSASTRGGASTSGDSGASCGDLRNTSDSAPDSAYHTASSSPANTLSTHTDRAYGTLPSLGHAPSTPPEVDHSSRTLPTRSTPPSSGRDVTAEFEPLRLSPEVGGVNAQVGGANAHGFYQRRLTNAEIMADVLQKTGSRFSIHAIGLQADKGDGPRFDEISLTNALKKLALSQPMMWAKVQSMDCTSKRICKRFEVTEERDRNVNLTYIKYGECKLSWLQIIEDQFLNSFDSSIGPLWRCVFLELKEDSKSPSYMFKSPHPGKKVDLGVLIFVIHDLISDSCSIQHLLMHQLPACLASPDIQLKMMSQTPPLDESFPMSHSHSRNSTLLSSLRRSLRRGSSKRRSKKHNKRFINIVNPLLHVGEDPMLTVAAETRIMIIDPESKTKRKLDHCCLERNVLPEDALMMACAIALKLSVRQRRKENPYLIFKQEDSSSIKCCRERSLREFVDVTGSEGLGMLGLSEHINVDVSCISQSNGKFPSSTDFWADVISASYKRNREPWRLIKDYNDLRASTDYQLVENMCSKPRQAHFSFEYTKNPDQSMYPLVTPTWYYSSRSCKDLDACPLSISCCDVTVDSLTACVAYNSRWLTREFVQCYSENLHKLLIHVAHPLKANMKKILKLPAFVRQQLLEQM